MRVAAIDQGLPLVSSELPIDRSAVSTPVAAGETSFESVMASTIDQANKADRVANAKVEALALGTSDDLHGTMIAVKEADISIRLVGTIRNKLLDAFTEIWKTSV